MPKAIQPEGAENAIGRRGNGAWYVESMEENP
jgi:hypothetical protein